jgi:hypothetical protein
MALMMLQKILANGSALIQISRNGKIARAVSSGSKAIPE